MSTRAGPIAAAVTPGYLCHRSIVALRPRHPAARTRSRRGPPPRRTTVRRTTGRCGGGCSIGRADDQAGRVAPDRGDASAGLQRGLPSRDGEPPPGRPRAVPQVRRTPGKGSQARTTVVADDGMMAQVSGRDGFITALDQSGGATPRAPRPLRGPANPPWGGAREV